MEEVLDRDPAGLAAVYSGVERDLGAEEPRGALAAVPLRDASLADAVLLARQASGRKREPGAAAVSA